VAEESPKYVLLVRPEEESVKTATYFFFGLSDFFTTILSYFTILLYITTKN